MKDTILFVGTGAADWHIAEKSPEYRRFSSVLINDELLIDPGPDIFDFEKDMGYTNLFAGVKNIIITHSHGDHYNPDSVNKISADGLLANADLSGEISTPCHKAEPFCTYDIGGYKITATAANHLADRPGEVCLAYIIVTPAGNTIFYGCDSAWLPALTWHELKKHKFDLMVFDGTIGNVPGDYRIFEHNSTEMVKIMCQTLRAQDVIKPDGKLMISHMAYTLHPTHEEIKKLLADDGIIPAYDNMRLEI